MGEITQLLESARDGDGQAWDSVIALIYDDLKRAARHVHSAVNNRRDQTFDTTGLVNECYIRLAKNGAKFVSDRAHFLALAARAMRQLLLNHARDRARLKRGAGVSHLELEPNHVTIAFEAEQVIAIDQALHALAREDERMVRIVECRIFAGLSDEETARALDLPLRTCQRLWALARTRIDVLLSD